MSRHGRPLLLFLVVVLAGTTLAVAGVGTNGPGSGTTRVIESSSDPYDAGLPEHGAVEDSGTAFGVIEATATPTTEEAAPQELAATPAEAPTSSPTAGRPTQQESVSLTDRGSTEAQARDRLRRTAAAPTAVPVPQRQTTPAPLRSSPSPTPTSTPTSPGLLEQLFG